MRANPPTRGALDFVASPARSIFLAGATVIHCGSHIIALVPGTGEAARIVELLTRYGLLDQDTEVTP